MAGTFLLNSNVLLYVGFVFNERGLYLPSLGFCALLAFALDRLCERVMVLLCHNKNTQAGVIFTFMCLVHVSRESGVLYSS